MWTSSTKRKTGVIADWTFFDAPEPSIPGPGSPPRSQPAMECCHWVGIHPILSCNPRFRNKTKQNITWPSLAAETSHIIRFHNWANGRASTDTSDPPLLFARQAPKEWVASLPARVPGRNPVCPTVPGSDPPLTVICISLLYR